MVWVMQNSPPPLPRVKLVPTSELPLQVKDASSTINHLEWLTELRYLKLGNGEHEISICSDFSWLSTDQITWLAKGEDLATPLGEVETPGRLRMVAGFEDDKLKMVVLEILTEEPMPHGMTFNSWYQLRFPDYSSYLHDSRNEAWWIHFHRQWVEETRPGPTLAPNDGLLHTAVLNNHEHWVEAILQHQPRIEVRAGSEESISETALGIAMENTGMFGAGPGFACGCHRRYRDDDFCEGEDPDTWVPRAERIAARLKAAGAVDYSLLLKACRAGRTDEVEAMLKAGFPPNFSIYGHTTALCEAVQPGHEDICDLLLCYGADPNLPRPFSTSMVFGGEIYPLTLAIDHPAILKRLLQAGADPNLHRDDSGETPVLFVRDFDSHDHAEEIFELVDFASIRGKHGRSGVYYLDAKDLDFCRSRIPSELLDSYDQRGTTPLLHAIITEAVCKTRLLIEMGADPNQPGMIWEDDANSVLNVDRLDIRTRTQYLSPIQAALQIGDLELVEFLLDHGATPTRPSIGLKIPNLQTEEEFAQLRDRLQGDVDALDGGSRLATSRYGPSFPYERTRHCEILLATLLIHQPTATSQLHGEFVQPIDMVELAEEHGLHPAAIEPFRSGRKLSKAGWMACLDVSIGALKQAVGRFEKAINASTADAKNRLTSHDLLAPLREAEHALISATLHITGKHLEPLNLADEVCGRASGDFEGGTARAYRDAETTGEVGFDDFIEALTEHFKPGTTMDHGKLLQAVQQVTKRLDTHCAKLHQTI